MSMTHDDNVTKCRHLFVSLYRAPRSEWRYFVLSFDDVRPLSYEEADSLRLDYFTSGNATAIAYTIKI